ncbi:oligosaccharide flippase family protein [Halalkalibacter krulwichiae]|uniref:Colanic acid exporter n=1 Tax=Halalkalibacter krulwichiae TaxID=199441 RepID=A0A1X9MID6_9BACI|nr:oligosaccharide flippase family protein [Halalkalibacter krulwichiae]ARK32450.1 colanic acid exporter [Halalkalibacter krulwichiae]
MRNKVKNLFKKPFVRNVLIISTGTAAAQAITMLFAPFITRIYGPEAFGMLGVFTAIVAVIAPVAALTYPIAIVLPKNDGEAKGLIKISLYVSAIIALIVALVLLFFHNSIVHLLNIEEIAPFLYLIPLVIIFSAFLQVSEQWLIRTKQFGVTAKVTFMNALILNVAKVGLGWYNPVGAVLVILTTLGTAVNAIMLILGSKNFKDKIEVSSTNILTIKELVKKYRDFPLYRSPQVFVNAISQSLPVLLLTSFFGPVSAGFYTISRTVLIMPISLIGKSVGDVFYPKITEATNNGKNISEMILKATLALAVLGVIPFGIVIAFGPWLFGLVFGSEWILAGEYARWLAFWLFFMFINKPSVIAIPILGLQKSFLVYEVISIIAKILALIFGFFIFENDVVAIALYSLIGVFAYIYLILWVLKSSKSYSKRY